MPFKFECPACGQHISADDEQAGAEASCPSCGIALTVPYPQPVQVLPPVRFDPVRSSVSAVPTTMRCRKCDKQISSNASRCPYCHSNVAGQSLSTRHPVAAAWSTTFGIIGVVFSFVFQWDFVTGAYSLTFGREGCPCCGIFALLPVLFCQGIYFFVGSMIGLFIGLALEKNR